MIKSMTAYGRGEYEEGESLFVVEIKSTNNRYRDIILRIPKALQTLEEEIRSRIASRVRRGRVEVFIQMERNGEGIPQDLELNLPLVRSYVKILKQLNEELGLDLQMRPDLLFQMKDVILVKPADADMDEVTAGLQEGLNLALDSFDRMRTQEGKAIEEDFLKRLLLIEEYLEDIEGRAPVVVEEYRKKLTEKINQVNRDLVIEENRLIQEVALFAARCDITEEIVRTRSHINQFRNYMAMDDSMGRRLDFLIQEINREVNTLSAKASDSSISARAVEMKAELEKLREQAQNVE